MDALEFYIGELEKALNGRYWSGSEKADALEEAARNLITAWDAENMPESNRECGEVYKGYVCNAGPDHSGDHVALNPAGTEVVAHWRRL